MMSDTLYWNLHMPDFYLIQFFEKRFWKIQSYIGKPFNTAKGGTAGEIISVVWARLGVLGKAAVPQCFGKLALSCSLLWLHCWGSWVGKLRSCSSALCPALGSGIRAGIGTDPVTSPYLVSFQLHCTPHRGEKVPPVSLKAWEGTRNCWFIELAENRHVPFKFFFKVFLISFSLTWKNI